MEYRPTTALLEVDMMITRAAGEESWEQHARFLDWTATDRAYKRARGEDLYTEAWIRFKPTPRSRIVAYAPGPPDSLDFHCYLSDEGASSSPARVDLSMTGENAAATGSRLKVKQRQKIEIPKSDNPDPFSVWGDRNPSTRPRGLKLSYVTPMFGFRYAPDPKDRKAPWEGKEERYQEPYSVSIPSWSVDPSTLVAKDGEKLKRWDIRKDGSRRVILRDEYLSAWESDPRWAQFNGFWLPKAQVAHARERATDPKTIAFLEDRRSQLRLRRWAAFECMSRLTKHGGVLPEAGAVFMMIDDEQATKRNQRSCDDLESLVIERLWMYPRSYLFLDDRGRLRCSWKYLRQWVSGYVHRLDDRLYGIHSGLMFDGNSEAKIHHNEWGKVAAKKFPFDDDGDESQYPAIMVGLFGG